MSNWTRTTCALFLSFALCTQGSAKDAETIFAEANDYTVRIDVTISTAFIEDKKGAGHGAGFLVGNISPDYPTGDGNSTGKRGMTFPLPVRCINPHPAQTEP